MDNKKLQYENYKSSSKPKNVSYKYVIKEQSQQLAKAISISMWSLFCILVFIKQYQYYVSIALFLAFEWRTSVTPFFLFIIYYFCKLFDKYMRVCVCCVCVYIYIYTWHMEWRFHDSKEVYTLYKMRKKRKRPLVFENLFSSFYFFFSFLLENQVVSLEFMQSGKN